MSETRKPKKRSSKTAKPQKNRPKPKPAYKTIKTRYNGDKWGIQSNYTNTDFIKVFVNVMDLFEAFVFWYLLASAGFSLPHSLSI